MAAGANHSLALRSDGTVIGWGNNDAGQISTPPGLHGVVAVAAGGNHSLALKSDHTLVAWGDNSMGQAEIPPGLTNVAMIASGLVHNIALQGGPIVAMPADLVITNTGASLTVSANVQSHHPAELQWYRNGELLPEFSESIIRVESAATSDSGIYMLLAADGHYSYQAYVVVDVGPAPVFTLHPAAQTVFLGDPVVFEAMAESEDPIDWHWSHDGQTILNSATHSLSITGSTGLHQGIYVATAVNRYGAVTSNPAQLAVVLQPLNLQPQGDGLWRIEWAGSGILQAAPQVEGTYTNVAVMGNSYLIDFNQPQKYFRLME